MNVYSLERFLNFRGMQEIQQVGEYFTSRQAPTKHIKTVVKPQTVEFELLGYLIISLGEVKTSFSKLTLLASIKVGEKLKKYLPTKFDLFHVDFTDDIRKYSENLSKEN